MQEGGCLREKRRVGILGVRKGELEEFYGFSVKSFRRGGFACLI